MGTHVCGASLCQARLQVHPWPHIPFCSWWAHLGTHMHEYTTPSPPSSTPLYTHAHACAHIHVHATPAVTLPQASSHTPTHSHPARHLSPLPRTPSPPNLDAPPTQPRRVHTLHALWHTHPCAAVTRAPAHTHIASRVCTCPQVYRCARLEPCTLMCLCTHAHLPLRAQVWTSLPAQRPCPCVFWSLLRYTPCVHCFATVALTCSCGLLHTPTCHTLAHDH